MSTPPALPITDPLCDYYSLSIAFSMSLNLSIISRFSYSLAACSLSKSITFYINFCLSFAASLADPFTSPTDSRSMSEEKGLPPFLSYTGDDDDPPPEISWGSIYSLISSSSILRTFLFKFKRSMPNLPDNSKFRSFATRTSSMSLLIFLGYKSASPYYFNLNAYSFCCFFNRANSILSYLFSSI